QEEQGDPALAPGRLNPGFPGGERGKGHAQASSDSSSACRERFVSTAIICVSASAANFGSASGSSSSPKLYSTFQEIQTSLPSTGDWFTPRFCSNTETVPMPGIATRYCVLTPVKETSITRPGPRMLVPALAFGALACRWTFSGRTPTVTSPLCRAARFVGTVILAPAISTEMESAVEPFTGPVNRFD